MHFNVAGAGAAGVADVKAHSFFATINFDKLVKRLIIPPYKPVIGRDDTFYFDSEFTSRTPRGPSIQTFIYLAIFVA